MTCHEYRRYGEGDVRPEEFASHREACKECREAHALDELIAHKARDLPVPTSAPGLWDRIAARLEREQETGSWWRGLARIRLGDLFDPRRHTAWKFATVGVAVVALLLLRPTPPAPRNLLTAQALARVEALEVEYELAIGELEAVAAPRIAEADTELLLRYRDRLETIDAQIRRCRAVLAEDPANAHVRRYLLAAYRDKRETLTELLALEKG